MKIRIATYNVMHCENFIKEEINYGEFIDALRSFDADIISLNEIRGSGVSKGYDAQAEILAKGLGYEYYFAKAIDVGGKPNPYGNALLSRIPLKECVTIPIPDPSDITRGKGFETRCILKAVTDTVPGITVLVTHFGLNESEQLNAVETVLKTLPEGSCILCGDFNVTPENTVLTPIRKHLTEVTEALKKDSFTFRSDKPYGKIDYIFVSGNITPSDCTVPDLILSDHKPVIADLQIN